MSRNQLVPAALPGRFENCAQTARRRKEENAPGADDCSSWPDALQFAD